MDLTQFKPVVLPVICGSVHAVTSLRTTENSSVLKTFPFHCVNAALHWRLLPCSGLCVCCHYRNTSVLEEARSCKPEDWVESRTTSRVVRFQITNQQSFDSDSAYTETFVLLYMLLSMFCLQEKILYIHYLLCNCELRCAGDLLCLRVSGQ